MPFYFWVFSFYKLVNLNKLLKKQHRKFLNRMRIGPPWANTTSRQTGLRMQNLESIFIGGFIPCLPTKPNGIPALCTLKEMILIPITAKPMAL